MIPFVFYRLNPARKFSLAAFPLSPAHPTHTGMIPIDLLIPAITFILGTIAAYLFLQPVLESVTGLLCVFHPE
jgi:hypothetical protein